MKCKNAPTIITTEGAFFAFNSFNLQKKELSAFLMLSK